MRGLPCIFAIAVAFAAALLSPDAGAQFRSEAFSQSYNDDNAAVPDSTDKLIDFKEVFGGITHKRDMRIGTMFGTSLFIPGASQIYNREYWKLPIFYTGIAGGLASGITFHFMNRNNPNPTYRIASICSFVGAGAFYYASLMDGVVNFKSDKPRLAGRATVYSILLPGLGQIYNGEYWKVPIYWGLIAGSTHFLVENNTNFIRFRDIYREAVVAGYKGPVSAEQAKYYRDMYRRYRDYSVLAICLSYLLQVIDANVFCYMNDFEVSENVLAKVSPTVILPEGNLQAPSSSPQMPAAGMSLALKF